MTESDGFTAFTPPNQHRKGLFEVADGGTLLLDEVAELDKPLQVKLLRFLESGEVRRVGENEPFRVDARVICATNQPLSEMVAREEFRQDLYFRINTFEIRLPSLRERLDDLAELARHLLTRHRTSRDSSAPALTDQAVRVLATYHWPGNVRELANVIEHAAILSGGGAITLEHLPQQIRAPRSTAMLSAAAGRPPRLRDIEMEHIVTVLERHQGNKPAAARELGISLKTLYNKPHQLQPS